MIRVLFVCIALCFFGCSSLTIKLDNEVSYNNGIAIIHGEQEKSKIQLEIAQEVIGGFNQVPFVIYVMVENLEDRVIDFSPANISFEMNNKNVKPYDFSSLKYSSFSISQALYDYGIEPTSPNIPITDAFFSASAYNYPIPFGGLMVYGFYNYSFARASYITQLEAYNARKFLISHYLRKNTLRKNATAGGFMLIPYNYLKAGNMYIYVTVGEDKYRFLIKLLKK